MVNKPIWARLAAVVTVAGLLVGLSPAVPAEAKSFSASAKVTSVDTGIVTITGKVSGTTRTHYAYLQYHYSGGAWHTWSKVTLASDGTFTKSLPFTTMKDRWFRVYKPREGSRKSGYSSSVKLDVSSRTETVTYSTDTIPDPTRTVCDTTPVLLRAGVNGSRTAYYLNGVFQKASTIKSPVAKQVKIGSSTTPAVTTAATAAGPAEGGTAVTVTGCSLDRITGATIGGNPATITSQASTTLELASPAGTPGQAPIILTWDGGSVPAGTLTYTVPARLDAVTPGSGPLLGGNQVRLTGAGLSAVTKVEFMPTVKPEWTTSGDGSMPPVPARKFTILSDTQLDVVVPPGLSTDTTIRVTTAGSPTTATVTYHYTPTHRDPTVVEQAFLDTVNQFRAEGYDCGTVPTDPAGPLTWDGQMGDLAAAHTRDMLDRYDVYNLDDPHVYPGLSRWDYRLPLSGLPVSSGEVIAYWTGTSTSSAQTPPRDLTVQDGKDAASAFFYQSTSHCKILMNPYAHKLGVGLMNDVLDAHRDSEIVTANTRA